MLDLYKTDVYSICVCTTLELTKWDRFTVCGQRVGHAAEETGVTLAVRRADTEAFRKRRQHGCV